jgi:hypothetical protein
MAIGEILKNGASCAKRPATAMGKHRDAHVHEIARWGASAPTATAPE